MGVYIKGFDFPKACWFCDFCRAYNEPNHGYFCCALDADLDKTTEIIQTQRDKHCPLVEVKPHGRLIDGDALSEKMVECSKHIPKDSFEWDLCGEVITQVALAPSIIESEGEK